MPCTGGSGGRTGSRSAASTSSPAAGPAGRGARSPVPVMLLPLVVVGAVVAWALGVPGRRVAIVAGAGSALLVLATVVAFVAIGMTEVEGDDRAQGGGPASSRRVRSADVVLEEPDERADFPAPAPPIAGLDDGDVLLVEADVGRAVVVAQCAEARCAPGVAVQPDDRGVLRALVAFERVLDLPAGAVDCGSTGCTLVLFAGDEVVRSVPLVFGPATVPRLVVGGGEVRSGDEVSVVLRGFPEGPAVVTLCAPPGPSDPAACGAPAPEVAVDVPASGQVTIRYPVVAGRVGTGGSSCSRRAPCAVAVPGIAAAAAQEVSFAALRDADPPRRRVVAGLAAAAVLLLVTGRLVRRTSWIPPEGDPFAGVLLSDPFDDIDLDRPEGIEVELGVR